MDSVLTIAQSGLAAAAARLGVAAENIAALPADQPSPGAAIAPAPTPARQLAQFSLPSGGAGTADEAGGADDLVQNVVGLMQASLAFKANLRVIQAGEQTLGSLLKLKT